MEEVSGKKTRNIQAIKSIECSAKNRENLKNLFYGAIRAALATEPETDKKECKIL